MAERVRTSGDGRRAKQLVAAALALALGGCVVTPFNPAMRIDPVDRPEDPAAPVLPSLDQLPPADSIALTLVDGSPGLGLWCDLRSDCIEAARIICANQQTIRTDFDVDRSDPRAGEYLSRAANAPHSLVVSCPVA